MADIPVTREHRGGRLAARSADVGTPVPRAAAGTMEVPVNGEPAGLLRVPAVMEPTLPLLVLLHGAGGTAQQALKLVEAVPEASRMLQLAPQAMSSTWDVISGGLGPDVATLDALLADVLTGFGVQQVGISGFSDGASYALTLGQMNGDLFSTVLAWSPGFSAATERTGSPQVYVSHGVHDTVLPIDRCSRRLVPQLRQQGYQVAYTEFDGPHVVPPDIAAEGLAYFLREPVHVAPQASATQPGD